MFLRCCFRVNTERRREGRRVRKKSMWMKLCHLKRKILFDLVMQSIRDWRNMYLAVFFFLVLSHQSMVGNLHVCIVVQSVFYAMHPRTYTCIWWNSQEWKRTPIINTKHDHMKSNKELTQRQTHSLWNAVCCVSLWVRHLINGHRPNECEYECVFVSSHLHCSRSLSSLLAARNGSSNGNGGIFAHLARHLPSVCECTFICFSYWSIAFN